MSRNDAQRKRILLAARAVCALMQMSWVGGTCGSVRAAEPEAPVHFADPRFQLAVEDTLGIANPTPTDMLSLTVLDGSSYNISSITGIEYAKNLAKLFVRENYELSDLAPLAQLHKLQILCLDRDSIFDLSPLAGLTNLTVLTLLGNGLSDIAPLAHLTNLTTLDLSQNQIADADLAVLSKLAKLDRLALAVNPITDIGALAGLKRLTWLSVTECLLKDISPLAGLTALTELYLFDNQITDLSPLTRLTHLRILWLQNNGIVNLAPVASLAALNVLDLSDNQIADLGALSQLTNLTAMAIGGNPIADVNALAHLTHLTVLWADHCQLTNITPLAALTELNDLDLSGNQIADISVLHRMTHLATLRLADNCITDITCLADLTELSDVNLCDNQIMDVSALENLPNLTAVDLTGNPLDNRAYCVGIPGLREAHPFLSLHCDPTPADCNCPIRHRVLFVDSRAPEGQDGSSWSAARRSVQDALEQAKYGDEIRVAQGIYKPDQGANVVRGDRQAVFEMKNGVALLGGYAGLGAGENADAEIDPNTRDVERFATILTGDLSGNDVGDWNDPSKEENSLHVVSAGYADDSALLDGFTITAGHADGPISSHEGRGGGMVVEGDMAYNLSFPRVAHCTFTGNYAVDGGGGIYCESIDLTDCQFLHNYVVWDGGGVFAFCATIQGCLFQDNRADEAGGAFYTSEQYVTLTDCVFTANSAGFLGSAVSFGDTGHMGEPWLDFGMSGQVTIHEDASDGSCRSAGWIEDANLALDANLNLEAGELDVRSSLLEGAGQISLGRAGLLKIAGWPGSGPTVIRTPITGPGNIEIDAGQQLVLDGDTVVDLSGTTGPTPDPNLAGQIAVRGSLKVQGNATVQGTNISVKLLDVNTPVDIQYNNVLLQEASTGFGGEFFVSGNARITHNAIVSEGDRYLDMDPDPNVTPRPTISNNRVTVVIKEGKLTERGTLLELRAKDYDAGTASNPLGGSGAYSVLASSPGFTADPSANWVLESLILEPNSKLNLTNRQGFEFQTPCSACDRSWETVYVKDLVLGANAILNTGLQTLYYHRLVAPDGRELVRNPDDPFAPLANGARFLDIPVLGFSLGIIAMDDPTPPPNNEFDIRVRRRVIDPNTLLKTGTIERLAGDPGIPSGHAGVMDMRTRDLGPETVLSVAAKGAFARAGDESITIEFEYLFQDDLEGQAQIVVYLSDDPEVGQKRVPLARVFPPEPGRPGSLGNGRFGVFSGTFTRGDLNFKRGTYVELELRGAGARCWIDNWDPRVNCSAICGDYDNSGFGATIINIYDYLTLLAEVSRSVAGPDTVGCLDLTGDGYVNTDDLRAWDPVRTLHRCPVEKAATATAVAVAQAGPSVTAAGLPEGPPPAPLLVLAKPVAGSGKSIPYSGLHYVSTEVQVVHPTTAPKMPSNLSDGRLVVDSQAHVYQVDGKLGLIRLDDNEVVLRPAEVSDGAGRTVQIGFQETGGCLLLDCAFQPQNPEIVYVVPVCVRGATNPYMAAAKLQLTGSGGCRVLCLYGVDPAADPGQHTQSLDASADLVFEPDMQHLCEVEISPNGKYLFVLNRQASANGNNRVLTYDEAAGGAPLVVTDVTNVPAPTAMLVSADGTELYLASSLSDANGLMPAAYRFVIADSTLTFEQTIQIDFPSTDSRWDTKAALTALAQNPQDGTVYAVGFTVPCLPRDLMMSQIVDRYYQGTAQLFTVPVLAAFSLESDHADAVVMQSGSGDLALPLSVVWVGQ